MSTAAPPAANEISAPHFRSAPPALRALLRPTRLAHGDTLLMCAAASQILYRCVVDAVREWDVKNPLHTDI